MFIDASAIVGILLEEAEKDQLIMQLERSETRLHVSALSITESILSVAKGSRKDKNDPVTTEMLEAARKDVEGLLEDLNVRMIPIDKKIGEIANDYLLRYGKIMRHPAELNMGDAYAAGCAVAYRLPLLYKGNDFSQTDLA